MRFGSSFSDNANIREESCRAVFSLLFYTTPIYVAEQPTLPNTSVAEFVDHKAIFTLHEDLFIASLTPQKHLDLIS